MNQMLDENKIVNDYQLNGVTRIRNFFSTETLIKIRNELERYILEDLPSKPTSDRVYEADGITVRNLWRLELNNAYFKELGEQPKIMKLMAKLVDDNPVLMAVETFNKPAVIGSGVPYHQDNAYFCQSPPDVLTLWIAIDQVTPENGPVLFVKGSHKQGMLATKPSGVVGNSIGIAEPINISKSNQFCATLNPGDATIHHCEIIHHSDPNQTVHPRLGLLFVYRATHTQYNQELKQVYAEAVATMSKNNTN